MTTSADTDTLAGLRDELRLIGCHQNGDARCTCAIGADALDAIDALRAQAAKDKARIERLEAALRPFATAGELFTTPEHAEFCQVLYAPAAGPDYDITERHVRAARAALEDGE